MKLEFLADKANDTDSVSIFINGEQVIRKAGLYATKPAAVSFSLNKGKKVMQVVMIDENAGDHSQAAAWVSVWYNGIKREINLKADKKQSALLYFEY